MKCTTALVFLGLFDLIFVIVIIYFAVHYSYWLLFLLIGVGISDRQKRILIK